MRILNSCVVSKIRSCKPRVCECVRQSSRALSVFHCSYSTRH